jgi:hypothetical protein
MNIWRLLGQLEDDNCSGTIREKKKQGEIDGRWKQSVVSISSGYHMAKTATIC